MQRLLYVTPVMPRPSGNGLAMRAATTLAALSRFFSVELFVVPVAGAAEAPSDFVLRRTTRVHSLDLEHYMDPHFALISRLKDPILRHDAERLYPKPYSSRFCTSESAQRLYEWSSWPSLAAVHVMRLYLAPFAEPFLRLKGRDRPTCVLDLDDDEVRTRRRLADLYEADENRPAAEREEEELAKYAALADRYLRAFDCITVCSAIDSGRLGRHYADARFAVVPNGYEMMEPARPRAPSSAGPLRLLFVGSLDYFPNADAVRFLCTDVRAALRSLSDRAVEIDIVGGGDAEAALGARLVSGVTLHGHVPSVAPFYADADIAIVPIRAGGGTRIKILEAFTHRVPVVSTSVGAEGIDALDGKHLLVADGSKALASACMAVKLAPALGEALTEQAAALCSRSYGAEAIATAIRKVYNLEEYQ
jgi:polysaccharide biosynthesis protein PslH